MQTQTFTLWQGPRYEKSNSHPKISYTAIPSKDGVLQGRGSCLARSGQHSGPHIVLQFGVIQSQDFVHFLLHELISSLALELRLCLLPGLGSSKETCCQQPGWIVLQIESRNPPVDTVDTGQLLAFAAHLAELALHWLQLLFASLRPDEPLVSVAILPVGMTRPLLQSRHLPCKKGLRPTDSADNISATKCMGPKTNQ